MADHPSADELRSAAAGDQEVRLQIALHLDTCGVCRDRLAKLAGVLHGASEILGLERAMCLTPEALAELPTGGEKDDIHVRDCPLCQTDLELIRALETRNRLGDSWSEGTLARPESVVEREAGYLQSVPGVSLKMSLTPGAKKSGVVAGAKVKLEVSDEGLEVTVAGEPEGDLVLVLESDSLEKRIRLDPGTTTIDVSRWQRAEVRRDKGR